MAAIGNLPVFVVERCCVTMIALRCCSLFLFFQPPTCCGLCPLQQGARDFAFNAESGAPTTCPIETWFATIRCQKKLNLGNSDDAKLADALAYA